MRQRSRLSSACAFPVLSLGVQGTKLQSIVAQLAVARNAYDDARYSRPDPKLAELRKKQCRDLLQAGLCELVGESCLKLEDTPVELIKEQHLIVTKGMPGGGGNPLPSVWRSRPSSMTAASGIGLA